MRWIFFTLVFGNLLLLATFWQKQGEAAPAPLRALEIPGSVKTLQLVSEAGDSLQPAAPRKVADQREALCYVAGPYADELDARHLLARVSALSLHGRINTVDIESGEPSEYWVHVPPRATREEALRTLKELQKRKFDSYIITQGDLAEGVSLGLFRNKESAYGLQKAVEEFDIPVEVLVVNKSVREYWVEVIEVSQLNERMRERIQAGDKEISWALVECSNAG
ncbi:SPOR domain-containing protein [Thalassolituus hydrocarboniclasticus]|uniref:SPOR domain-containing protein n=1 Tax=Thalassolituus hydrocarboniclasticus TaxID=2742796 RepID=A0ABY6AEI1_9GAMM|nr:SPOR domain-containing protein [Thalassolituus hydrocarboniclasticus]UXD88874.1 SPOR domain-containing protein [Thalassolituus hydrocarboniclasticus]